MNRYSEQKQKMLRGIEMNRTGTIFDKGLFSPF